MFSKAKGKEKSTGPSHAATEPVDRDGAKRTSSPQTTKAAAGRSRPAARSGGVPSIVSGDMIIRGAIESAGEIQFDGEIEGDIRAKGLVIGEGAKVTGEVVAEKVRVCGIVEGAIRAVEVELAASAFVKGDITHTSLSIESGARFEGNCRHADDPIEDASPSSQAPKPAPPRPTPPKPGPPGPGNAEVTNAAGHQPAHPNTVAGQAAARDRLPQVGQGGQSRELMPQRQEPAADRSFVAKPAAADLR